MTRHLRLPALVILLGLIGACNDGPEPSLADKCDLPLAQGANRTVSERWYRVSRDIIARREPGPLRLARHVALVSVALYNAEVSALDAEQKGGSVSPVGAAGGAVSAVLTSLYPLDLAPIDSATASERARVSALSAECITRFTNGVTAGARIGAGVLASAATDRTDLVWAGPAQTGPGIWTSAPPPAQPLSPRWGEARGWFLTSGSQFRPVSPPPFGSTEERVALAEVRRFSDTRTPEQLRIAQFWGNTTGNLGAVGIWSDYGFELANAALYSELRTARLFALIHMAAMDAMISCWEAKYAFWYIRPNQADPAISTPVGRPNFPAWPSAHSCFSASSGGVLAANFPTASADIAARIQEAGEARIYAGLHYRFDITAGQAIGASVAQMVNQLAPSEGIAVTLK